ncbi:MAG: hypothetical protein EU547_04165 [Promethearchaeota archaeon]|nr:MAG: hypothetical protein EU547_04165 [Candidatus Lokiarchaeota archaeon]
MIDLKKYSWLLILIGGILVLLAAVLPTIGYIDTQNPGNFSFTWIFGLTLDENGIEMLDNAPNLMAVGTIGAITLIIFSLIFIISSIITVATNINLPIKEYIWLILGFVLIIFPVILRGTMGLVVKDYEDFFWFVLPIDLFTFFITLGGLFSTIAGLEEIIR